jgi:hypothetical protein
MPDPGTPDERSISLARKLAGRIEEVIIRSRDSASNRESERISVEQYARELEINAPLADVSFMVDEFVDQWQLAAETEGRMPCVQLVGAAGEEMVPLSIPWNAPAVHLLRTWNRWWRRYAGPPDLFYDHYYAALRLVSRSEDVRLEPVESALKYFRAGMERFFSYRIAFFQNSGRGTGRGGSGGPPTSSSSGRGLPVSVKCNTHGLALEFSHAYFLHFLNFGAPTSPVSNFLWAGRYVFRGTGPTYPGGTPRSPIFVIPPDQKPVITNF